jgi:hypothetical protein
MEAQPSPVISLQALLRWGVTSLVVTSPHPLTTAASQVRALCLDWEIPQAGPSDHQAPVLLPAITMPGMGMGRKGSKQGQ